MRSLKIQFLDWTFFETMHASDISALKINSLETLDLSVGNSMPNTIDDQETWEHRIRLSMNRGLKPVLATLALLEDLCLNFAHMRGLQICLSSVLPLGKTWQMLKRIAFVEIDCEGHLVPLLDMTHSSPSS